MSKNIQKGDTFIVCDVNTDLPPDRAEVICITDYFRTVDGSYDYGFKEWRFDAKFIREKVVYWLKKK